MNGKTKYPISAEIDQKIIAAYQNKVGMGSYRKGDDPVKKLAAKLRLPRWKISRRAIQLGVIAKQKKEPNWSDKELSLLRKYAHLCPENIQVYLKNSGYIRSVTGIVLKRTRMRYLQDLKGQSATTLALCFGVDAKTILRWINKGWLKAERRGTNRTERQGGDMWFIKDKWIRDFICESVAVIDFRKIDKYWLVDLLTVKGDE